MERETPAVVQRASTAPAAALASRVAQRNGDVGGVHACHVAPAVPFADNLVNSPSRHRAGSWGAGTASPRDLGLTSVRRRGGAAAGGGGFGLRLRGVPSAKYARMLATR
jgi:hypothetical protein